MAISLPTLKAALSGLVVCSATLASEDLLDSRATSKNLDQIPSMCGVAKDLAHSNKDVVSRSFEQPSDPRDATDITQPTTKDIFSRNSEQLGGAIDGPVEALVRWQAQNGASEQAGVAMSSADAVALAYRFSRLASRWKSDTRVLSSLRQITAHPCYAQVINMGWAAVPLILNDLQKEPAPWFGALKTITGCDPVPVRSRGKLREMAAIWIAWGRSNGVVS